MTHPFLEGMRALSLRDDVIPQLARQESVALYFADSDLRDACFKRLLKVVPERLVFSWSQTMTGELLPVLAFQPRDLGSNAPPPCLFMLLPGDEDSKRLPDVRGALSQASIRNLLNPKLTRRFRDHFWETFVEARLDAIETRLKNA